MALYVILPIVFLGLGVLNDVLGDKKIYRVILAVIFGLGIFIPAALRYYVGTDYASYIELFRYLPFYEEEDAMELTHEKGFLMPIRILSISTETYVSMFVFIAVIISAGVAFYTFKHSSNIAVSAAAYIFFGTFFYSMNFMRQFISGVIIMYALEYAGPKKKSFVRYTALILFASVFHWSSLLMIPFYFILQIKLDNYMLSAYFCVSALIYTFSDEVIDVGIKTFYTKYEDGNIPDIKGGLSVYYLIGYAAIFILAYLCRNELVKRDPLNTVFVGCSFFIALFELLGAKHAMLSRFGVLFIVPVMVRLVPEMFEVYRGRIADKFKWDKGSVKSTAAIFGAFAVLGAAFYICLLVKDNNGVIPYRTFIGIDPEELI